MYQDISPMMTRQRISTLLWESLSPQVFWLFELGYFEMSGHVPGQSLCEDRIVTGCLGREHKSFMYTQDIGLFRARSNQKGPLVE